jgi:acyl-ACP thioesterase
MSVPGGRANMKTVDEYQKRYQIKVYEIDWQGWASPAALLNFFQDAASDHAAKLAFSVQDLLARGLRWVLSRYHVKFFNYPRWKEEIEVQTWPSGREGLFAFRDFEAKDCSDQTILAAATSSWMVLNLETKRPVRADYLLKDISFISRRVFEADFETLPALEIPEWTLSFEVSRGSLDFNQHVNHVVYIEWALESVPDEIYQDFCLAELEVNYRGEAFKGQRVQSRSQRLQEGTNPVFLHQIILESEGSELTRLRTSWKKK